MWQSLHLRPKDENFNGNVNVNFSSEKNRWISETDDLQHCSIHPDLLDTKWPDLSNNGTDFLLSAYTADKFKAVWWVREQWETPESTLYLL